MDLIAEALRWLAVAAVGVYLGAMLTEGCVLVPFWRASAPADFLRWYADNDRRLVGYFGPLTSATLLLALAAAGASLWDGHPGRWLLVVAATLTAVAVGMYFAYFERVNVSFAKGTIDRDDVATELARWNAWHWARTCLSAVAFAATLAAVASRS